MIKREDIKKVIDQWDPIELLAIYAPPDEYDSESNKIFDLTSTIPNISVEKLGEVIFNIFRQSFGDDVFTKTYVECKEVASTILGN